MVVDRSRWSHGFLIGQVGIQREDRVDFHLKQIPILLVIILFDFNRSSSTYLLPFGLSSLEPFYGDCALFPINARDHRGMDAT